MEQRLIDRDNVLKGIEELKQSPFVNSHDSYVRHMMREALDVVAKLVIEAEPTVEAEPKHGKWIEISDDGIYHAKCPFCGTTGNNPTNYCPQCGRDMREEYPEINPCEGCGDYDGKGGCKSDGGCGRSEDDEQRND